MCWHLMACLYSWLNVVTVINDIWCMLEGEEETEVIFNCFACFCVSLYTYLYGATTASNSLLNFKPISSGLNICCGK